MAKNFGNSNIEGQSCTEKNHSLTHVVRALYSLLCLFVLATISNYRCQDLTKDA